MAIALDLDRARDPAPESSDRSFGCVFAAVFAIIGGWPLAYWEGPRWWALAIAAAFAIVTLTRPGLLNPLNRRWIALGRGLHRAMSTLMMGGIFFLCVTPIAWIMWLRGKDVLQLRRRPDLSTYWIPRDGSPMRPEWMRRQF